MITQNVKLVGGAALGAIALVVATYSYATRAAKPELVAVAHQGCGTASGAASFSLPLKALHAAAPNMAVAYEPLGLDGTSRAIRINFDRAVDGRGKEVMHVDETLALPLTFGRNDAWPTRIRITCREGVVSAVRYERDRANTTFSVARPPVRQRAQPSS